MVKETSARASAQAAASKGFDSGKAKPKTVVNQIDAGMQRKGPEDFRPVTKDIPPVNQEPQKTDAQTLLVDEVNRLRTMEIDELSSDQCLLISEKTNDPAEAEKYRDLAKVKQGNDNKADTPKIQAEKDWESERKDDDPFKIEQGDIIEYLMKDVILASAAWVGNKVANVAGYGLYKLGSYTYHGLGKLTNKGYEALKEDYKKHKENVQYTQSVSGDHKIDPRKITDPELRAVMENHNREIDSLNGISKDTEALGSFITTALSGANPPVSVNGNNVTWTNDHSITIPKDMALNIINLANAVDKYTKDKGMSAEEGARYKEKISTSMNLKYGKELLLQTQVATFASSYAAAQLLANGKPEGVSYEDAYTLHRDQGRLSALTMMQKLRNGETLTVGNNEVKNNEDIVALSSSALKYSYEQRTKNPNGNFINNHLVNIDTIVKTAGNHGLEGEARKNKEESLMAFALSGDNKVVEAQQTLADVNNKIKGLEREQSSNDDRREQIKKTRQKANGQNNQKQNIDGKKMATFGQGKGESR